jgi:syntaxin-binding protein 5
LKSTSGDHPEEPVEESSSTRVNSSEAELSSSETTHSGEILLYPLVLLCCENSLHLLSAKTLIQVLYSIISLRNIYIHIASLIANEFDIYGIFLQGNKKSIRKVEHLKPCYWTTILKKDDKFCGILSLLQTGTFEIR